jgi:diaminohydroxyphosphoribosylaminopyrimidine deaminase / 5-amino-6-(5-phosphoribosylamino)uracil reductase
VRVIVDSSARMSLDAKVIESSSAAKTIVAVTAKAPQEKCQALKAKGVEVLGTARSGWPR